MKLKLETTQKIIEKFLKKMGEPFSPVVEDIYFDLLNGEYSIDITTFGKFTVAEIIYYKNDYEYHFMGISAKNPDDEPNPSYGIKNAVKDALGKILAKFYIEEQYN